MNTQRLSGEGWLDPVLDARITCRRFTWNQSKKYESIQMGNDLYLMNVPEKGTSLHSRDFAEIMLISRGSLRQRVNGEYQLLTGGTLCFLRPDDEQMFLPDENNSDCEIVFADFKLELFLSFSIFFENDVFLRKLTEPVLPPCFHLSPDEAGSLFARLLKVNSITCAPSGRKIKLKLLLANLFSCYFLDEGTLLTDVQVPDWLEYLCSEMRSEQNLIAGLPRMQKLACHSPGHLCKYFQRYLGKTPTEFINELRINRAADKLASSHEEIAVIAARYGFRSLSRFYKLFRRHYGCSPAAYRRLRSPRR